MHVALLATTQWLDEDLATFRHLVVGLVDEQVRVTQVVPKGAPHDDAIAFGERLTWRDSSWSMVRRRRLRGLAEAMEAIDVGLVHALSGDTWQGAVDLGGRLQVPVVLVASSSADLNELDRLRGIDGNTTVAFVATTAPIARAIKEKAGPEAVVHVIRPGVHVAGTPPRDAPQPDAGALCMVVSGDGVYDADYDAVMTAIGTIRDEYPSSQFFFAGDREDQHVLWQWAKRYGLLSNISMVPRQVGHRELTLRAHALIHPQALGRSRTVTLQAMASGVPVLASQDEWLDYLVDEKTAWISDRAIPEAWVRLIKRVIHQPTDRARLTQSAWAWVRKKHLASSQVEQVMKMYRQVSGEAIKFPAS